MEELPFNEMVWSGTAAVAVDLLLLLLILISDVRIKIKSKIRPPGFLMENPAGCDD
jgi:hypothetical protein